MISKILKKDVQDYFCKTCSFLDAKSPPKRITLPSKNVKCRKDSLQTGTNNLAKALLLEELQCNGCTDNSNNLENRCIKCDMIFHSQCLENRHMFLLYRDR